MKLFIDTSNSKFILALIKDQKVVHFSIKDTNRDVAKNANKWLKEFLKRYRIKLDKIEAFYTTIGPGSFTGVKVSANIINTLTMIEKKPIYVINVFTLLNRSNTDYTAIPFGKGKYYIKYNKFWKPGFKTVREIPEGVNRTVGYEHFDRNELEKKLVLFKSVDKVQPMYPKIKYN